jgi:hypothetical protein
MQGGFLFQKHLFFKNNLHDLEFEKETFEEESSSEEEKEEEEEGIMSLLVVYGQQSNRTSLFSQRLTNMLLKRERCRICACRASRY